MKFQVYDLPTWQNKLKEYLAKGLGYRIFIPFRLRHSIVSILWADCATRARLDLLNITTLTSANSEFLLSLLLNEEEQEAAIGDFSNGTLISKTTC